GVPLEHAERSLAQVRVLELDLHPEQLGNDLRGRLGAFERARRDGADRLALQLLGESVRLAAADLGQVEVDEATLNTPLPVPVGLPVTDQIHPARTGGHVTPSRSGTGG